MRAIICSALMALTITMAEAAEADQDSANYLLPYCKLIPSGMADRVKAEREEIFHEHTMITDAMNNLAAAADHAQNADALDFARAAVADSLSDMELMEPMTVVIGDYIRAKLPPPQ